MTTSIAPRRYGMAAIALFLAGAAFYALMIGVTLAHIETVSNQVPFDMRPLGYDPAEARNLLHALGEDGRSYYLTRQIPLDTVYPALLAMALVSAILFFGAYRPGRGLVRTGIAFSVGAALFDYAENLGIGAMILIWPDLPDSIVRATSAASIAKAGLTTAAAAIVLLAAVGWLRRPKAALELQVPVNGIDTAASLQAPE